MTSLIKKQKGQQVREIVKGQDDSKPWGQDNQVKVCNSSYRLLVAVEDWSSVLCFLFIVLYVFAFLVQVGCRLIQLLTETAYIQPPVDQLADGPPDIRPAFIHTQQTVCKDSQ